MDDDLADPDRFLIVVHAEPPQHSHVGAVFEKDWKVLRENRFRIANSVDECAAAAVPPGRHRHHFAPLGGDGVAGTVPHDDALRRKRFEHFGAHFKFTVGGDVRRAFDGEGAAAELHVAVQRMVFRRKRRVHLVVEAENVVDGAGIELQVTFAQFGVGYGWFGNHLISPRSSPRQTRGSAGCDTVVRPARRRE